MAALGLVHVVRGHQQRGAGVGEFEELFPEIATRFRIHRTGRFVEEQQFRLVDHRAGQRQTLLLPAAHRASQLLLAVLEVVLLDQLIDPSPRLHARDVLHGRQEFQVLAHRQVLEQRELLGHVADAGAQLLGLFRDAQTQHFDVARRRREQSAQHADGGGFSGAVRAEEAIDMTTRNVQIDIVHRHQCAEALGQATDTDRASFLTRRHRTPPAAGPPPGDWQPPCPG